MTDLTVDSTENKKDLSKHVEHTSLLDSHYEIPKERVLSDDDDDGGRHHNDTPAHNDHTDKTDSQRYSDSGGYKDHIDNGHTDTHSDTPHQDEGH